MSRAIEILGLGKRYRIGGQDQVYASLREDLTRLVTAPFRRGRRRHTDLDRSAFWALRDVRMSIDSGEVVGIIGRNGAGKSTLLKVLSRITLPTEGMVRLHGRVGSLLEVGTGFHPELTGRENIFLSGAILGMSQQEIRRRFDEIVAFSEIERFLDTPTKHYSSGMFVRLGFAVAAHLDPEILLVDEVLAVGDYGFQSKCLRKMRSLTRHGRTILLVSHNMHSITNLCSRAVWIDDGRPRLDGPPSEVVAAYLKDKAQRAEASWPSPEEAPGSDKVRLRSVAVMNADGESLDRVEIDQPILVRVRYWNLVEGAVYYKALHLKDQYGSCVLASMSYPSATLGADPWSERPHPVGLFESVCELPPCFLNDQTYTISVMIDTKISAGRAELRVDDVVSFSVIDTGAMRREYKGAWIGSVRPRLRWSTERLEPDPDQR